MQRRMIEGNQGHAQSGPYTVTPLEFSLAHPAGLSSSRLTAIQFKRDFDCVNQSQQEVPKITLLLSQLQDARVLEPVYQTVRHAT